MITPPPRRRMADTAAWLNRNRPFTLTASTRSSSASSISVTGLLTWATPALLTRMSSPPNAASVACSAASISALRATSHASAIAPLRISAAAALAASAFTSSTATRAPSRAKVSAMHRPMPEPAPVTMAALSLRRMFASPPQPEGSAPAEAVLGPAAWLVLAADPARIAEPVQCVEYRRIVDLALVRLGPRGYGRDLHVPDQREEFLETGEHVAADDLHVIEVELDLHVRPPDLGDEIGRLLDPADEIVGPVARVERLDQQRDVLLRREIGRGRVVRHEHPLGRRPQLGRDRAGHGVGRRAPDCHRVGERLLGHPRELPLPPPKWPAPALAAARPPAGV